MTQRPRYSAPLSAAEQAEFVPFMHELVATATAVIKPLFMSGTAVDSKGDASPVTAADRGAEAAMRTLIEARYPAQAIVGEEYGNKPGAGYRWILDPVDGTRAFISHCFLFGTLIALERAEADGWKPVLGAIAHPVAGLALLGHASEARLHAADGSSRVVQVRPCAQLAQATVLASSHWSTGEQQGGAAIERLIRVAKLYRTWGDCFGYFALATGGADLMLDPQLAYWDVAAIVPVIEGAGGCVTAWDGGDPLRDLTLIASAGPLHEEVLALLRAAD
jgi:myo-inositol-1(or 4)-monophosphatase